MKTKIIFTCLVAIIAISLLLSGCASSSPSAKAAIGTPTPSVASTEANASTATHAPYNIQFLAGRTDSAEYALTTGLADLINKNSTWLRATVVQTSGLAANFEMVVKKPETKATSIICGAGSLTHFLPMTGTAAGTGWTWTPYNDFRFIVRLNTMVHCWATTDENIKTMADFQGKRIYEGNLNSTRWMTDAMVLKQAGVYDSIKFSHGGFGAGAKALGDGLVDVAIATGYSPVIPTDFVADPTLQQLTASKQIYFVSYDKAAFDSVIKKYGIAESYFTITKPGLLGPNQTGPVVVKYDPDILFADKSMPDDVVNEFLRIFVANINNLADYQVTGKWITTQTIGFSGVNQGLLYHPAALKFYKDNGIPTGVNPPGFGAQ